MCLTLPSPSSPQPSGGAVVAPAVPRDLLPFMPRMRRPCQPRGGYNMSPPGQATPMSFLIPVIGSALLHPSAVTPPPRSQPSGVLRPQMTAGGDTHSPGCHVPSAITDAAERQVPPGPPGTHRLPAQPRPRTRDPPSRCGEVTEPTCRDMGLAVPPPSLPTSRPAPRQHPPGGTSRLSQPICVRGSVCRRRKWG